MWLRLIGIDFPISYGPDQEPTIARALLHLQGDLHPHFFSYPSFYSYFLALVFGIFSFISGSALPVDVHAVLDNTLSLYDPVSPLLQPYYLLGRGVTIAFSIGTIILVYLIGKRAYGNSTGIVAMLFLAMMPLHIRDSHYVAVDIPATFWVVLAAYFAVRATETSLAKWYLLSGVACGLAAGTKYPAGLAVSMPLLALAYSLFCDYRKTGRIPAISQSIARVALILSGLTVLAGLTIWFFRPGITAYMLSLIRSDTSPDGVIQIIKWSPAMLLIGGSFLPLVWWVQQKRSGVTTLLMALLLHPYTILTACATLLAFLVVVPYAILDPRAFLGGVYAEMMHSAQGHYGIDMAPTGLVYNRGIYFLLAGLPFSMGLPLYLVALGGLGAALFKRAGGDLVQGVFILSYYFVAGLNQIVFLRYMLPLLPFLSLLAARLLCIPLHSPSGYKRTFAVVSILVVSAYTALFAGTTTLRYASDTRDEVMPLLSSTFPKGTTVATTDFVNYSPSLDPNQFQMVKCPQGTFDIYALADCQADVVILTGMLFLRPYRDTQTFPSQQDGYEMFRSGKAGYRLIAVFERDYFNKEFYISLDPMYEGYYVSPIIEVYERVDSPRE
ncbi:MAG: glycosyltransferase family 39 protein [Anaerolineae bacterium]|nr:glycosyltransferase family 39 protein [Anaerolineae bacterium]